MKLEQIPGDYDNVDQRALELIEEALYRNAYIYPGWKYCLPGLLKTIYL